MWRPCSNLHKKPFKQVNLFFFNATMLLQVGYWAQHMWLSRAAKK